jgi:citrate lyase subunit beta/citryl-CoA lyase/(S)-citramalyl-CoA lyase
MASFRSLLFVPGQRPDRFAKAIAAGADAVCLDLEDAVPPPEKAAARAAVVAFLGQPRPTRVGLGLRINGTATPWSAQDVEAVRAAAPDFIMVPKATDPAEIAALHAATGRLIWPLIETADGLLNSWTVASAHGVAGVIFGGFDYAADVGCTMAWEPLLYARSTLAAACARARVQLLDSPCGNLTDMTALSFNTLRAKALGFTGRACIHPDQIAPVNAAFTPTEAETAQALRILAAFEMGDAGAAQLDGKLIELPVALAARRVLERRGD